MQHIWNLLRTFVLAGSLAVTGPLLLGAPSSAEAQDYGAYDWYDYYDGYYDTAYDADDWYYDWYAYNDGYYDGYYDYYDGYYDYDTDVFDWEEDGVFD